MINVDSVYQKVLALANKEQRGYITPQEYNLFARKAQSEIFEGYFHDLKTSHYKANNDTGYADEGDMIREKLHRFQEVTNIAAEATEDQDSSSETGLINLPYDSTNAFYKLISVERSGKKVEEVDIQDLAKILDNPLTSPTVNRSVYTRIRNTNVTYSPSQQYNNNYYNLSSIQIHPAPTAATAFTVRYYRSPVDPRWNYQMILGNPLYLPEYSKDFEIHSSDESLLIDKILLLAGIAIQKPDLVQAGLTNVAQNKQSQND